METADILILGGGVAGLSAAAALAPEARVVLAEAEDALGHHASGRSAALFLEHYGNAVVRAMNAWSAPVHRARGVLSPRGLLVVAGPGGADMAEGGLVQAIDVAEAVRRVPILNPARIARAAYAAEAADIDTDRLMQGWAREARQAGAEILTRAPASAIRREGDAWVVRLGDREVAAGILVNAAGAWADQVAERAGLPPLGLVPHRRSMARLPAPGGRDVTRWPVLEEAGERWYAKPDAGKWLVSPADADPVPPQDAWADDMVVAEGIARYQAFVTEEVTRVESTWAGLRTFAPDGNPVIGADPAAPGFFWLAGQGGYGFQIAPAAARLLSDLVEGRPPDLAAAAVRALAPARFRTRGPGAA